MKVTVTQFQQDFDTYYDAARQEPVLIMNDDHQDQLVLLSVEAYNQLIDTAKKTV